jgi:hypothetical protein
VTDNDNDANGSRFNTDWFYKWINNFFCYLLISKVDETFRGKAQDDSYARNAVSDA